MNRRTYLDSVLIIGAPPIAFDNGVILSLRH